MYTLCGAKLQELPCGLARFRPATWEKPTFSNHIGSFVAKPAPRYMERDTQQTVRSREVQFTAFLEDSLLGLSEFVQWWPVSPESSLVNPDISLNFNNRLMCFASSSRG